MTNHFIVLLMLFLHIVDDYYLQGILASMKQQAWWRVNAPAKLYEKDYLMALAMHGFSWTFMVMLPIAAHTGFDPSPLFYSLFLVNWACHFSVDNMKANLHLINLILDQTIHIIQILVTAALLLYV